MVILAAGLGTFAMRASFLVVAHRLVDLPPGIQRVLRQIPPAALAALIAPAVLRPEGALDLANPRLVAAALATAVCWRTRSVVLTLGVGMGALVLLEL
jgi:branched-subunit amino acid transport protein